MGEEISQQQELEAILKALEGFYNGASRAEIKLASGLVLDDRTLQRRLAELVKTGRVMRTGKSRAQRYFLAGAKKIDIHLSDASREILHVVSKPMSERKKVGYNTAFLQSYIPNKSFYLSVSESNHLEAIGKTSTMDQPAGTYAKKILGRLLIDLSWNSSRLEGNTYSLLDTRRLIEEGIPANEVSAKDTQMILNHKEAIEFIVRCVEEGIGLSRYTILSLHALLSNNLLPDSSASGRLRQHAVGIGQSVYTPSDLGPLIEEHFDLILEKVVAIKNPFEQAFFVLTHLPYLQPFDDVNKRVSRLAANIPLCQYNFAPLSFADLPKEIYTSGLLGIYELNKADLLKDVFIWAYERSAFRYANIRQTIGEPDPFRLKYREQIKAIISRILTEAWNVEEASSKIKEAATNVTMVDRDRFIEAVETELLNLHEGNFARYWVTPAQFKKWQKKWNR